MPWPRSSNLRIDADAAAVAAAAMVAFRDRAWALRLGRDDVTLEWHRGQGIEVGQLIEKTTREVANVQVSHSALSLAPVAAPSNRIGLTPKPGRVPEGGQLHVSGAAGWFRWQVQSRRAPSRF